MAPNRQRLRDVDAAGVIADYETGVTVAAICEQYRVGLSMLYRLLDDHHVPRRAGSRAPGHRVPEDVEAAVASAFQAGESTASIAARFGVSKGSVSNIGRRYFRERVHTRRHDELVSLIVAWFIGDELAETERDAITRVGVRTRLTGLQSLEQLDAELRPAVATALRAELLRWA